MLMQIRIGLTPKLKLLNRPEGRSWLYDFSLFYIGSYSYLYSHIAGQKAVWDDQLNEMCQRMANSGKNVQADKIMDFTSLEDWKCYFYNFDLLFAKIF